LKCARAVAEKYPEIKFEEMYLDTVCLKVCDYKKRIDVMIDFSFFLFE
jgi:isocitrate dehydrogenase (NAD+)